jgi:hypothetical protein
MQLALFVALFTIGGVVLLGIAAILIDKSSK